MLRVASFKHVPIVPTKASACSPALLEDGTGNTQSEQLMRDDTPLQLIWSLMVTRARLRLLRLRRCGAAMRQAAA